MTSQDTDGDGQTDAEEALAGTNPNNPADYLRIVQVTPVVANEIVLTWSSVPGKSYNVQTSAGLSGWMHAADLSAGSRRARNNHANDCHVGRPSQFYRILVNP